MRLECVQNRSSGNLRGVKYESVRTDKTLDCGLSPFVKGVPLLMSPFTIVLLSFSA